MKKTAIRALSLLFAASLLTAGLTGCTQELEGAELTKAYETAVQNALAEDVGNKAEREKHGILPGQCVCWAGEQL